MQAILIMKDPSVCVPEHAVVKTLVMEDEHAKPLLVLMHGDRNCQGQIRGHLLLRQQH